MSSTPYDFGTLKIGADRSNFWDCSGVDDFAYRSGGSVARRRPFHWRRTLVGAEVVGDRPDLGVDDIVVLGGRPGPQSAQPGAPEFRFRNPGPLYRLDQSNAGQLQTG